MPMGTLWFRQTRQGAHRQEFQYDSLDRLAQSVTTAGGVLVREAAYVLDPMGNRQVVMVGGMAQPYLLDPTLPQPADAQVHQYTVTPFDQRQYDENGNLYQTAGSDPTDPTARVFTYDYANRLVLVSGSLGTQSSYAYDALGRRIRKVLYAETPPVPMQTNRYLYAGGQVSEENDGGGTVVRTYAFPHVFDSKDRVTITGGGEALFHHCDDQSSTLALTDAAGNVVERFDYDDYGTPSFLTPDGLPAVGSDGLPLRAAASGNPYLFHGLEWDDEIGLHFASTHFDPKTGSYLTRTHVAPHAFEAKGRAFAGNNPWSARSKQRPGPKWDIKKTEGARLASPPGTGKYGTAPGGYTPKAATGATAAGSARLGPEGLDVDVDFSCGPGSAASAACSAIGGFIAGDMPNRISMSVTVPKQTQGATFGEKVNAGLHAAGGALAQGAAGFRPAFFDIFTEFAPAGLGAKDYVNHDGIFANPTPGTEVLAHELAHVVQQREGSPNKTKHDTAKNSIGNIR